MNQKLVTKKNQKIRHLREQYPGVRCKIFYQRDYVHLLVKYGLQDPSGGRELPTPTRLPGPPQVFRIADSEAG